MLNSMSPTLTGQGQVVNIVCIVTVVLGFRWLLPPQLKQLLSTLFSRWPADLIKCQSSDQPAMDFAITCNSFTSSTFVQQKTLITVLTAFLSFKDLCAAPST